MEELLQKFLDNLKINNIDLADLYQINVDDDGVSIHIDPSVTKKYFGEDIYDNPDFDEFYYDELHDDYELVNIKKDRFDGYLATIEYAFDDDSIGEFEITNYENRASSPELYVGDLLEKLYELISFRLYDENMTINEIVDIMKAFVKDGAPDHCDVEDDLNMLIEQKQEDGVFDKHGILDIDVYIEKMRMRKGLSISMKLSNYNEDDIMESLVKIVGVSDE